jgi:peptidoglycan/xylan/chitin deacetylase (PgdA/CDA1 family)
MTLDENGNGLGGDPYQRLKNLFDITRVAGAAPGPNQLQIKDTANGILSSNYANGEVLKTYDNLALNGYAGLSKPGTVLAEQVVAGQNYNAVIATQTGGRNLHFSDPVIFADSNLPWQGLEWSVYGDKSAKARVGLDMTRNVSMFISRDDVDISRFLREAPSIETKLADIMTEWKTKYNFVGSHYINIGNIPDDPLDPQGTNWEVMRPIYQRILALGHEIGTHGYTHPDPVNALNDIQLKFEFDQSRLEINQQLGIQMTGAAVPGNPENTFVHQELDKYFQYFTGVGTSYNNAFGFLTPTSKAVYFAPNTSFDFTLIDFKKLTVAQSEAAWAQEYAQLTKHGNNPFVEFAWHDYGVTEKDQRYTKAMFENFIARAAADGTEFITLDDAQKRIRAFEQTSLTVNQVGDTITAQTNNATDVGKFAIDIDQPNKFIKSVTNYYAYDNDSVFTTKTGGTYTINLANTGTAADDVSHITALAARSELISVSGDGSSLSFSFNGEGKVSVDMKALGANQSYNVTGADAVQIVGDKVELTFNGNKTHTAELKIGASTPSANVINGTNNADTLNGGATDDRINGLGGNDSLNGGDGRDYIIGGTGNDRLVGGADNDTLVGADAGSATPGRGEYDVLRGNSGSDLYILGDSNNVYYDDGNSSSSGRNDYAAISGFGTGDVIQLKGTAANYTLTTGSAPNNGRAQGTLIQSNVSGQPELIGFVLGVTNLSLTSTAFSYV